MRRLHPTLSEAGLITDIESWEAEWCLEIIEALYDYSLLYTTRQEPRATGTFRTTAAQW